MNLYVYSGYGPYLVVQAEDIDAAVETIRGVLIGYELPGEDVDAVLEHTKQLRLPAGSGVVVEWWG